MGCWVGVLGEDGGDGFVGVHYEQGGVGWAGHVALPFDEGPSFGRGGRQGYGGVGFVGAAAGLDGSLARDVDGQEAGVVEQAKRCISQIGETPQADCHRSDGATSDSD